MVFLSLGRNVVGKTLFMHIIMETHDQFIIKVSSFSHFYMIFLSSIYTHLCTEVCIYDFILLLFLKVNFILFFFFLYAVYKNNWHFYPKRVDFTVKVFLHVSFIDFIFVVVVLSHLE